MLAGTLDHPVELRQDLVGGRRHATPPEQLLEDPRIPEGAAREHDGGNAGCFVGLPRCRFGVQTAAQDDRRIERAGKLGGERVVGCTFVSRYGRAGVEGDRADACLVDEAVR